MARYTTFEQLDCYKKCRKVRIWIFKFLKNHNVQDRDIRQNIIRAGRSTTRNLVEGFGRYQYKENRHFCRISLGSLHEILDDFNILEDEQVCSNVDIDEGKVLVYQALKSTKGYIEYLGKQI